MSAQDPRTDPALPLEAARHIDALGDAFERAWREGGAPPLEPLLAGRSGLERAGLLRELLALELEFRQGRGERPLPEEYARRFPADADLLALVLREAAIAPGPASAGAAEATADSAAVVEPGATLARDARSEEGRKPAVLGEALPPTVSAPPEETGSLLAPAGEGGLPATASFLAAPQAPRASPPPIAEPARVGAVPRRIGRYAVEGVLGEGAFGTVYLARDEELRREVAIKVPRRARVASEKDLEAYLAEARMVAGLDHPGIVPVFDVGRTGDGLCYVVSKLIPGTDLARRLREGTPALAEAASIVARVAEALHHAHQRGLVHRDVKPANLLLDRQGNVYVADFGLALPLDDPQGEATAGGTPAYMSPEQARGEVRGLDARSDLFSLGIVLYELLTGQRPFRGATVRAVLEQIVHTDPLPPTLMNAAVPGELSRVCVKCLAREPADRFPSALELALALRRWLKSAGQALGEAGQGDRLARRLVPERLQPFAAQDADLYVGLLPNSRVAAVPPDLRFWKEWLERAGGEEAFGVGLLTGRAGVGKSSLVLAGLLPRLDRGVLPVHVTAARERTADHLRKALARAVPGLPDGLPLPEAWRRLAQEPPRPAGKVLLVLDQFERWLLAEGDPRSELAQALAQCDGRHLQALLVVREDFRPIALRLLNRLGLPALPGRNVAELEPFDRDHAYRVLVRLGQAYGRLPPDDADISPPQQQMLLRALDDLSRGGKVNPCRLAQLARGLRDLPWTPVTLSRRGGLGGAVVAHLEGCFDDAAEGPGQERRAEAARAILGALVPAEGRYPAAAGRPLRELWRAARAARGDRLFAEVLSVLEEEIRLVVPDAVQGAEGPSSADAQVYRLADETLAPALRQWLPRRPGKRRASRRMRKSLLGQASGADDFRRGEEALLRGAPALGGSPRAHGCARGCALLLCGVGFLVLVGLLAYGDLLPSFLPLLPGILLLVVVLVLAVARRLRRVRHDMEDVRAKHPDVGIWENELPDEESRAE